jgi:hypothetical protein
MWDATEELKLVAMCKEGAEGPPASGGLPCGIVSYRKKNNNKEALLNQHSYCSK